MNTHELRALQAPLKQKYRDKPGSALVTSRAQAVLDPQRLSARLAGEQPRIAGRIRPREGAGRRHARRICCSNRWWRAPR